MRKSLVVLSVFAVILVGCGGIDNDGYLIDAPSTVLVFTGTGTVQCEDDGLSVSETAQLLSSAGIDVLSSSCGHLLLSAPAVCGAGTSDIHIHEIPAANANDAEALRFGLLEKVVNEDGAPNYQEVECETEASL